MTYKATAVKVHQDPGSTSLTSVPLTSVQWYEVEDVPCGVPCWEKGTVVSVWTVAHPRLRSLPGLTLQLWCLVPCNPLAAALTQEYPTCICVFSWELTCYNELNKVFINITLVPVSLIEE